MRLWELQVAFTFIAIACSIARGVYHEPELIPLKAPVEFKLDWKEWALPYMPTPEGVSHVQKWCEENPELVDIYWPKPKEVEQ